eukprot:5374126-Prymnesium_polylepis.1
MRAPRLAAWPSSLGGLRASSCAGTSRRSAVCPTASCPRHAACETGDDLIPRCASVPPPLGWAPPQIRTT